MSTSNKRVLYTKAAVEGGGVSQNEKRHDILVQFSVHILEKQQWQRMLY